MSLVRGDGEGAVNRKKFLQSKKITFESVVPLRTIHRNKVHKVTTRDSSRGLENSKTAIKADAVITNEKDIYLLIRTADCLPIAVYDPENKAIGLIHASRHNISKIIKNTIQEMKNNFGNRPEDLVVGIGPSIGPCHYEIDLWRIAEEELEKLGIKNIYNPKICTYESKDYFSRRRSIKENLVDNYFATIFGMK